jgi:hypothetical protein
VLLDSFIMSAPHVFCIVFTLIVLVIIIEIYTLLLLHHFPH